MILSADDPAKQACFLNICLTTFINNHSNHDLMDDELLNKIRRYSTFFAMLAFIIIWTVLVFAVGPRNLVEMMGVHQTYLVVFFLAIFGALSSLTTVSIYPAIGTFAAGGTNPLILGIVSGIGLTIGDSFFFFFGKEARVFFSRKNKQRLRRFIKRVEKRRWLIPIVTYIYVAFTPFPNNVLIGALAVTGYRFRKLLPPLLLGDLTLPLVVSFLTVYGMRVF
ncbi:hypothetical protein GF345_04430 [Candidatus Woesearchaeota archaeon]|nr:hypothetical protein [Candidatus Woesearchaeota archaeon]